MIVLQIQNKIWNFIWCFGIAENMILVVLNKAWKCRERFGSAEQDLDVHNENLKEIFSYYLEF